MWIYKECNVYQSKVYLNERGQALQGLGTIGLVKSLLLCHAYIVVEA